MRKTAIAAYAVMDSGPAMIRRIKALDASKQTFRCCTLTAEKNSEDMAITPGRIAFAAILKKKGGTLRLWNEGHPHTAPPER